jgi:hypothetical protein
MLGATILVLLVIGFFAFLGFASEDAKKAALASSWVLLGLATLVSVLAALIA